MKTNSFLTILYFLSALTLFGFVQPTASYPNCPNPLYCGKTCCPEGDYVCNADDTKCIKVPTISHLILLVPIFTVSYLVLVALLVYLGYNFRIAAARDVLEENIHVETDPSTNLPLAPGGDYDPRELMRAECPYCHLKFAYYAVRPYRSGVRYRSSLHCPLCDRVGRVPGTKCFMVFLLSVYVCVIGGLIGSTSIMTQQYLIDGYPLPTLALTIAFAVFVLPGGFFLNDWSECFNKDLLNIQHVRLRDQVAPYAYPNDRCQLINQ